MKTLLVSRGSCNLLVKKTLKCEKYILIPLQLFKEIFRYNLYFGVTDRTNKTTPNWLTVTQVELPTVSLISQRTPLHRQIALKSLSKSINHTAMPKLINKLITSFFRNQWN